VDTQAIRTAIACKCPRCGEGSLYPPGVNLVLLPACPVCNLNLAKNDSADGPAVFLIFLLGFSLVPLALLMENIFAPPLWFHAVFWGAVALGATIGLLRPLKAYIIALQFKHRPGDWE
jgi:uncharacterized protein (DUF983 family)